MNEIKTTLLMVTLTLMLIEIGGILGGNPAYLANALKKLHTASQKIPMNANPVTSHMFIVNPLKGGGILFHHMMP